MSEGNVYLVDVIHEDDGTVTCVCRDEDGNVAEYHGCTMTDMSVPGQNSTTFVIKEILP